MKKTIAVIILSLMFTILHYGCRKKKCEGGTGIFFNFSIPFTISPIKDTLEYGDTIWIESVFSEQMYNPWNDKTYTVPDYDFQHYIYVNDLAMPVTLPVYNWILVDSLGNILTSTNEDPAYVKYRFENGMYYYKMGLIMLHSGFFALRIHSFIHTRGSDAAPITRCPNESIELYFPVNNGNNNRHLLQYSDDPNARSWLNKDLDKSGIFPFVVKYQ